MELNIKHKAFADDFVLSNDAVLSYQKVYPKCNLHSAQTKSGVLLKNVEIATYIKEKQDKIRIERENSAIDAIKNESNANILQREKAIEMVSNVAKLMYNQLVKSGDKKPSDVMAFNSTVERLAKMDGWDKPTKIAETDSNGKDIDKTLLIEIAKKLS